MFRANWTKTDTICDFTSGPNLLQACRQLSNPPFSDTNQSQADGSRSCSNSSDPSFEKIRQHQRTVSRLFELKPDFNEASINGTDPLASSKEISFNK